VPTRVSPTDRIHRHIDDLFAGDRPLPEILEEVARLGAQLLMQAALEAEVTEFPAGTATPARRPPKTPGPVPVTATGR
jgi:putative transposase